MPRAAGRRRKLLKQRNPRLLEVLLGRHANVVTLQRAEGIRLKEEYHAFRDRTGCAWRTDSA